MPPLESKGRSSLIRSFRELRPPDKVRAENSSSAGFRSVFGVEGKIVLECDAAPGIEGKIVADSLISGTAPARQGPCGELFFRGLQICIRRRGENSIGMRCRPWNRREDRR